METKQIAQQNTELSNPNNLLVKAIESGSPIETIERLVKLQEEWQGRQAKAAFAKDFILVKPLLPLVVKTKSNKQTSSKYASLEDINKVIDPLLSKHGFGTGTKVVRQDENSVTIKAELWHKDGHVETTEITLPIDNKGMQGTVNKTMIHGISSTVTYGKRIALCALLNISTGDDTDGNQPPKTQAESKAILESKKKQILAFKTSVEINQNYKQIEKEAEEEGILPGDLKTLHTWINNVYKDKKADVKK